MRVVLTILFGIFTAFGGWIGGSLFPAPAEWTSRLHADTLIARLQTDLATVDFSSLQASLSQEKLDALVAEATRLAADAGKALTVERVEDADTSEAERSVMAALTPQAPAGTTPRDDAGLSLCPRMTVTNAPKSDQDGRILQAVQRMNVNGVELALDPTHDTCLSSGFGMRGKSLHKGIDFYNPGGGTIKAAGDGVIVEMKYRDDYGNMLLIDHGQGVYTRYSHLSTFARGLKVGAKVGAGDEIGLMGNTAAYPIPIHLHYEVLTGDYNNPKKSFGLSPQNPFDHVKAG